MVSSSELFDLIKVLSKAEKRYFTLGAGLQDGEKSYLMLFREVEKMEVYDEKKLKENLSKQGFKIENLPVAKSHLANTILKSLRSFHEGNNPEQTVFSLITGSEILKKKGLYKQSLKQLVKAKQLAQKFELHSYLFEILDREVFINFNMMVKFEEGVLQGLFDEIDTLKKKVQREMEMKVLTNRMLLILQTKPFKHPATVNAVNEIMQELNARELDETDTFFSKLYYFFTFAMVKRSQSDFASVNLFYLKILELWDRHPNLREIHRRPYKVYITNYLNSCHTLGNYEPFGYWWNKYKSMTDTNFDEEFGSFKDLSQTGLLYLLNTGQFKQALDLAYEIEKGLIKYRHGLNKARETTLRFNVFITLFINEKFSKALEWLQSMSLDDKIEAWADIRSLARIMRIIVHYELGHTRIIDSLRTSVYRKLKKEEQLHEFERTILDHIRMLEAAVTKSEVKRLWKELFQRLNGLGEKYGWNKIPGLEEIAIWAESKVLNRSYLKLMEEKKQR
jgi:hypothetical protein